MKELPDFFWADRLTPINFYGYTSTVRDRFYEVNSYAQKEEKASDIQRFMDLKRKCMAMCVDMRSDSDTEPDWRRDIWDNKVVIECKTEGGGIIFVGYYDGTYSIGAAMYSRDGRTPRAYRAIVDPDKELST